MLAVDMSNYTDSLSPTAIQGLKDAGVGHVIVQAIDPPPGYPVGRTRAQIQACLDAGLTVDAYVWLWFDLDVNDIQRKLRLLNGLNIRQLWLDVEDTAAIKYDQATCEAKVASALAECDAYPVASGAKTGLYSGRWFWLDRRYMGNCTVFSDRLLWDANYDEVADANLGYVPYGGWATVAIKQFRGSTAVGGVGGLDLNVLSFDLEAQLTGSGQAADSAERSGPGLATESAEPAQPTDATVPAQPAEPASVEPAPVEEVRETPDDWPWPTWYEAAIQYKAIADQLGQSVPAEAARETPEDWRWATWYEAAIQYKAIADDLGQQVADLKQTQSPGPG